MTVKLWVACDVSYEMEETRTEWVRWKRGRRVCCSSKTVQTIHSSFYCFPLHSHLHAETCSIISPFLQTFKTLFLQKNLQLTHKEIRLLQYVEMTKKHRENGSSRRVPAFMLKLLLWKSKEEYLNENPSILSYKRKHAIFSSKSWERSQHVEENSQTHLLMPHLGRLLGETQHESNDISCMLTPRI